jgi:hypothetical protein
MLMNKTQKGFAHIEMLLLLILVAIIGFTGWFVWHARSQANKSLSDTLSSGQSLPSYNSKKKTVPAVTTPKKTVAPKIVNYSTPTSQTGVEISSEADVDKLDGASDSFKDYVKEKFKKHGNSPSPCGNAYGLTVKAILNDSFAVGGEGQCGGAEKLWAKVASQWQEIGATQDSGFACDILKQYNVPSAIAGKVCLGDKGVETYDKS